MIEVAKESARAARGLRDLRVKLQHAADSVAAAAARHEAASTVTLLHASPMQLETVGP